MLRSIEATADGLGADGARVAARVRATRARARRLTEDILRRCSTSRATPSGWSASDYRAALPATVLRAAWRARRPRPVRRRRRARDKPAEPADELAVGVALIGGATASAGRSPVAARGRSPTPWPPSCGSAAGRSRPACE